jgi:DnaJ-class molecular chaperone
MMLDISLKEAQVGFTKTIVGINGEAIVVKIPKKAIVDSNYVHTIQGEGMPIRKEGKIVGRGDLLVKFNIKLR